MTITEFNLDIDFLIERAETLMRVSPKIKTFNEALRVASNEQKLRYALKNHPLIYFKYKKLNGEERIFLASKAFMLPDEKLNPNGKGKKYTSLQVRFIDTLLREWRSIRIENIIEIYW